MLVDARSRTTAGEFVSRGRFRQCRRMPERAGGSRGAAECSSHGERLLAAGGVGNEPSRMYAGRMIPFEMSRFFSRIPLTKKIAPPRSNAASNKNAARESSRRSGAAARMIDASAGSA